MDKQHSQQDTKINESATKNQNQGVTDLIMADTSQLDIDRSEYTPPF